jgi:hypothetical protein
MSNEIILSNETQAFELLQRKANLLSTSTLVPKEFQGNMANCAIGLNIAKRLGADEFMVLQNIDIIHGRPSFRATFLIAMVNASGRFSPLQFRMEGQGDTRSCVAHTTVLSSGEVVEGPAITMAMAKAEGWSTKNGSKWLTMPELMLRYRAAAFFARIYAPDITLGMQTSEELYDTEPTMRNVTPTTAAPKIEGNPYEEPAKPKAATKPKAADKQEAEVAPEPAVEPEVLDYPSRVEMVKDIKETWKKAEINGLPAAEAIYKKNGLLPPDMTLSKLNDAEVALIWKAGADALKVNKDGDAQ